MRYLLFLCCLSVFTACTTYGETSDRNETVYTPPTDLEGPAYDPADSPAPMTTSTPLPLPPGTVRTEVATSDDAPGTYGDQVQAPQAYQSAKTAAPLSPDDFASPSVYQQTVLSGNWVNAADEREIVQFTPTHYKTFYEGELLVEEDMTYHAVCPGDCSGGTSLDIPCFTIAGPAQTDCYGIVRLTDEVLEMSLLGVSTETILYRKVQ